MTKTKPFEDHVSAFYARSELDLQHNTARRADEDEDSDSVYSSDEDYAWDEAESPSSDSSSSG